MKEELMNQQVLAMYDVRGIQSYIFKSNAAKEIVGASALVEKIITNGLREYVQAQKKMKVIKELWIQKEPQEYPDT